MTDYPTNPITEEPDDMWEFLATTIAAHREITTGDHMDLISHTDGAEDLSRVWAPRIRTWDDASRSLDGDWSEPRPCRCRYPHAYRPTCQACMIEFMSKARRTWDPDVVDRNGEPAPRWVYDAEGEYGAHYQSTEIDGHRAHLVHYPTHGPSHLGTWILVITEFLYENPVTFKRNGQNITYTQRAREVIGFREVSDYAEGFYSLQELVEQWRATLDYKTNGWDNYQPEVLAPMGAAVVSPEFLDQLVDEHNGLVVA